MLKDKESKLLTLQSTLTTKERGIGEKFFSEDQVEILIDKVNKMVIPFKELQATGQEVHFSSPVEKLYYVLDEAWELQHTIDSITKDKDDMRLIIVSHAHEIEYLKKVIETMRTNHQDLESKETEFTELTLGLEKIIQMLGGNESVEDKKTVSAKGLLLSLLERLTMGLSIECENSKSRIQELGAKLQVKEKMVDDLSTKVKSLEESFQPRLLHPPESVKERTLFEPSSATGSSEISEIEVSRCEVMAVQQKIWEKLENYLSEPVTGIILTILAEFSLLIALYFSDSLLYMSVFSLIGMFFMALHFVIIIKGYPDGQGRNQGKVSEGESPKFVKQLEKEAPPFHRSTLPENTPLIRRIRMKKNN
ncbi:hypothetical protein J5N97_001298 [Dioscorea zingiberensis]|uniref:Uncharacterized protein n=1 Tax=Dioscorea zingiberensis TaxID=325984 RepID=A0A9D5H2I5_9LILI|nr:hypothetical protein J5N97_001298 [Dioscorea zingiberensis]